MSLQYCCSPSCLCVYVAVFVSPQLAEEAETYRGDNYVLTILLFSIMFVCICGCVCVTPAG